AAARSFRHCVVSQPSSFCVEPYATFNAKMNAAKKKNPTTSFIVVCFFILCFLLFISFAGDDPSGISASTFLITKLRQKLRSAYASIASQADLLDRVHGYLTQYSAENRLIYFFGMKSF